MGKRNMTMVIILSFLLVGIYCSNSAKVTSWTKGEIFGIESDTIVKIRTTPLPGQLDENRGFQGIPSIARSNGGRLWAAWYGGMDVESEDDDVYVVTSGDNGQTWTDPVMILDGKTPIRCFDEVMWTDPLGRIWLFWSQAIMYQRNAWIWAMVTEEPDQGDGGWSQPFKVAPGIMLNKPTVLSSGEWLLTVEPGGRGVAQVWSSCDEGKTFELKGGANIPPDVRSPLEHMLVERSDSNLWMLVRTKYGIGEALSKDQGKTWSELSPSSLAHPSARFHLRKLNSGNLLLVKHGPLNEKTGRECLSAYLSEDEGETWIGGLVLDERSGISYPDGCIDEDGAIYIIYDYQRTGAKEILMAVFHEEDVRAGRMISGSTRFKILVNKAAGVPLFHPQMMSKLHNQFHVDKNVRGTDPSKGLPTAVMNWAEGEKIQSRRGMTMAFPDQDRRIVEWPKRLLGSVLIRSDKGKASGTCCQSGIIYVVTPSRDRHPDSSYDELLRKGFLPTNDPEFVLFYGQEYVSRIYWKKLEIGEHIDFDPWTLVLLPE